MALREEIIQYCREKYGSEIEYPWRSEPDYAVERHAASGKWYAVFLYVRRDRLGETGPDSLKYADILNVKADPFMIDMLTQKKGFRRAYHMNKQSWLTIMLDGTVSLEEILPLIDESAVLTAAKKDGTRIAPAAGPRSWIIPANPRYYDIISEFRRTDEVEWRQYTDVRPGDMVYIYMTAPYSCILYRCRAVETGLPRKYDPAHPSLKNSMLLHLERTYEEGQFTLEYMKSFDVGAVRGTRRMPDALREDAERRFGPE